MTSDTTPSGLSFGTTGSEYQGSSPYMAFTRINNNVNQYRYLTYVSNGDTYVGYRFDNPVCVKIIETYLHKDIPKNQNAGTCKLQASNDGTNYTDLTEVTLVIDNIYHKKIFSNNNSYKYYRLLSPIGANKTEYPGFLTISELQFYGRP